MSAPVLSRLFTAEGKTTEAIVLTASNLAKHKSIIHREASNSLGSAGPSTERPPYPTLRANPFPEVTDLFCRLPLSTLFYRPEASNLGDLMRLWVRPGVRIIFPSDFQGLSRAHRTPRMTRCFTSHNTLSLDNPISG